MLTVMVCQRSPTGSWVNLAVAALCDDQMIHIFLIIAQHKWSLKDKRYRLVCSDRAWQRSSLICVRACVRGESPPQSRPLFKAKRKSVFAQPSVEARMIIITISAPLRELVSPVLTVRVLPPPPNA